MKLCALAALLLFINEASSHNCSYHAVLEHLQLSQRSTLFTRSRPVKNHTHPTELLLDVLVYAILDVVKIDQTFVSYIWSVQTWENDYIRWDVEEFCGIESVVIPVQMLWMPDITIEEMTERDKSSPSPYLHIYHNGTVTYKNDQVVLSTCRIRVYKFPFDTQMCDLSFKSVLMGETDIRLSSYNSTEATQWSRDVMRTQYEWHFVNITVTKSTVSPFDYPQDMITYSILVQRSSMLYIVNFILPVLFFLFLDFASFLMPDTGGEKLGFKITVLLAVTVMQLLLNDILPSSSRRIPLIAVYCIGIFSLMLLSLLETIIVLHLINKDQMQDQGQSDPYKPLREAISLTRGVVPMDLIKERGQVSEQVLTTLLAQLLQNHIEEEEAVGYWMKKSKTIHKVFFSFYATAAASFLAFIFYMWKRLVVCETCSYLQILEGLNLTSQNPLLTLSRPVKLPSAVLEVDVDFQLKAILDVHEIEQTFLSDTSIEIGWMNQHISWDEDASCRRVKRITVPSDLLWKPDLRILEMVDKDKTPLSPFLVVKSDGYVMMKYDQVVLGACRMQVYKFPFDTQRCSLSIKSFVHSIDEILLVKQMSDEVMKQTIFDEMQTQYEWLFIDIQVDNTTSKSLSQTQSQLVYTFSMRRRAILYVVNFILPLLFFLALDFASFLMPSTGGDKLSFKITILLAVTVLQLLLNEILPSSSNFLPLIAVFCMGVFWLMKVSLLETIFIMYLLERDNTVQKSQEKEAQENLDNVLKKCSCFTFLPQDVSNDFILEETEDKEDGKRRSPADSGSNVDKLVEELRQLRAAVSEAVGGGREPRAGYWSARVPSMNRVFMVVYSACTAVFLLTIFYHWLN
ncbi:uncharacterized protein LOC117387607 [Periophthalmus magnuspinnatus]|uniref:uncharacterized protein LOC117387607 n=1 Tax=Periophthalmus magnuspinnatus TaxID=409849 RepID=UPI00243704FD|nr:uncharacterized protein LOC117387607 [Periophthalmus magnuspinnatus]